MWPQVSVTPIVKPTQMRQTHWGHSGWSGMGAGWGRLMGDRRIGRCRDGSFYLSISIVRKTTKLLRYVLGVEGELFRLCSELCVWAMLVSVYSYELLKKHVPKIWLREKLMWTNTQDTCSIKAQYSIVLQCDGHHIRLNYRQRSITSLYVNNFFLHNLSWDNFTSNPFAK